MDLGRPLFTKTCCGRVSLCTSLDVEGNLRVKTDVFGFYNQFGVDLTSFDNSLMATSMSERSPSRPGPFFKPALESGLYDQTREVGAVCPFTLASVLPWGEVEEKPRGRRLANLVQSEGSWRDGSKNPTAATTSVTKVPRPLVSSGLRNSVRRGHDRGLNPL